MFCTEIKFSFNYIFQEIFEVPLDSSYCASYFLCIISFNLHKITMKDDYIATPIIDKRTEAHNIFRANVENISLLMKKKEIKLV